MMTYEQAEQLMKRARLVYGVKRRNLGARATCLEKCVIGNEDVYAVYYHDTPVVTIHRDGSYTLNSGGWRTVTTKARINEYSPVYVYQKAFVWYVGDEEFRDGMKVGGVLATV